MIKDQMTIVQGEDRSIKIYLKDEETLAPIDLTDASVVVTLPPLSKSVKMKSDKPTFLPAAVDVDNNKITITDHGFVANQVVQISNTGGALPTGISALTDYYILSPDENSFKLSTSAGGSAVDISGQGTGTHKVELATVEIGDEPLLGDITLQISDAISNALKDGRGQDFVVQYTIAGVTRKKLMEKAINVLKGTIR